MRKGTWKLNGLFGSVCSLRKELASFLTCYCRAPTPLDPENVSGYSGGLCSGFSSELSIECKENPQSGRAQEKPANRGPLGSPAIKDPGEAQLQEATGTCPLGGEADGERIPYLHRY